MIKISKAVSGAVSGFIDRFEQFVSKISQDDVFTQAAALAYYTTLSMAPLIILLITFLSALNVDIQVQLLAQVRDLIGPEAALVLESILGSVNRHPDLSMAAGWIGFAILAISASVVFAQLQNALNVIFMVEGDKTLQKVQAQYIQSTHPVVGFILRRLLSVGMLLAFMFIAIVSLLASASVSYLISQYDFLGLKFVNEVASFFVFTVLFALIYKWMPDRKVKNANCILAGAITSFLFVVGKAAIGTYLGQTAIGSAYGAAGSLIVMLAWIYYSTVVFFVGAEISAMFLIRKRWV
ncbi:YihY/virulence factor BrkB family protein [Pseudobdellovibrio exovorus]|uniref:RNase BN n=1 Tax=Pseudobdellovibrio exovorus JSS TaxID=1184267 RepID=M4VR45_9BACT|nr:YihY/virulence factor BrkB family protein [Pseudobdellovibrio exovorus]AGH95644.1 RNase BN [Pseudobdellovibrio exovorus JSS]